MRATDKNHKIVAAACGVFVLSMLGAAYAAVPLYDLFCRVTGFGGTPRIASASPTQTADRVIRVRFDGNVAPGLDWQFRPVQREMNVRIGETVLAFYRAKNTSTRGQWGTASYNVTPNITGGYFSKIHCFCFEKQHLSAGEEMDMPVQFFIDPSIVEDASLNGLTTITLSYTFFAAEPPALASGKTAAPKL
jgi:cytochrome c oxidase assembly protein subunit 11